MIAVALATGRLYDADASSSRGYYRLWPQGSSRLGLSEELSFAKRGLYLRSKRGGVVLVPQGQDPERVRQTAREEV